MLPTLHIYRFPWADHMDRYQCLEAIVRGAFPNEPVDAVSDLQKLGQRMGYKMPNLTDQARPSAKIEDLVRIGDPQKASQMGLVPTRSDTHSSGAEGSQQGDEKSRSRTRSDSEEAQSSLIRDPSGNEHYIGPSGTLNFLSQLRKLVDVNNAAASSSSPEGVAKFALDDTAQALEADEQREEQTEEQVSPAHELAPSDGPSPSSITSAIARDFTRFPTADMNEVLKQFPPDEVLEALIQAYFKNVHDDFPLFHRATFEDEYELYIVQARRGQQMPRNRQRPLPDWGWIGCLHMMIVFGSITNRDIPNVDHASLRRKSVTAARSLLPQFISKCSLSNVRVLLMLSLFLHNNNERNAAWNLVGTATRIAFALGLHRSDMSSSFRPLEREVRKWVFCTLYSFEQFLASCLGRPSGLQEIDVEIVPPREGFVDGGIGTDAKLVSWSLKLQSILARTRLIHVGRRTGSAVSGQAPTVDEILGRLDKWKRDISQAPGFDLPWIKSQQGEGTTPSANESNSMDLEDLKVSLSWKTRAQLRAVLLLHIQFHYITIVATRPVLLRNIAMQRKEAATGTPGTPKESTLLPVSELCVKHACQLAYLIILLDSFEVINGLSGLEIFYAYCAAMILILRLLRAPRSDASPSTEPDPSQAQEDDLQACLRGLVYKIQDVINRADKAGTMKRFGRVVDGFAECIDKPSNNLPTMANYSAYLTAQQAHGVANTNGGGMMPQYGYPYTSPEQFVGDHGQMGMPMPFTGSNMEGLLDFLPFSTFGGAAGVDGSQMAQFLGSGDLAMPDWSEMEMLLGGYGGPA